MLDGFRGYMSVIWMVAEKDEIYSFRQEKDLDGKKTGYPAFHHSHVE